MKVTIWGCRGSLPSSGPETRRYGGNTACVHVRGEDGTHLVLDAGTGIRRLGATLDDLEGRVDILLTHLHMDHIQGLGFFAPIFRLDVQTHLWGPASPTLDLRTRLSRYLSPPLFPVVLAEFPTLTLHEVPCETIRVGDLKVDMMRVCHPGPTMGYRISEGDHSVAFIPDHEPALGVRSFPEAAEWTSGHELARGADLLIHDAHYDADEYPSRVGWGHSSLDDALRFADLAGVERLVTFHHAPDRNDDQVDRMHEEAIDRIAPSFPVTPGAEGATFVVGDERR